MPPFMMKPLHLKLKSGEEIIVTDIEIMYNGDIWLYNEKSKMKWINSELFDLNGLDLIEYCKEYENV